MSLQIGRVRYCFKCGLAVDFADPNGLNRALKIYEQVNSPARVPAVPPGQRESSSQSDESESPFWRRRMSSRIIAVVVGALAGLFLLIWGTARVMRLSHDEAMKMMRGPQYEDKSEKALTPPD